MRMWIDCEWNDFRGPLISMALVAEDGREWYEVTHCTRPLPWVAENVMPVLGKKPVNLFHLRASLGKFLAQFDKIHLIADWYEDISRFCELVITGPGQCIDLPPMTMEIFRNGGVSEVPHNALYDARGIRLAYIMSESAAEVAE